MMGNFYKIIVTGLVLLTGNLQRISAKEPAALASADSLLTIEIHLKNEGHSEAIYRALGLDVRNPETSLPPAKVANRILQWLAQDGYFFAKIDTIERRKKPAPHLYVFIDQGRKLKNMQLQPQGLPAELLQDWQERFSDLNKIDRTADLMSDFLNHCADNGYPFAHVRIDSLGFRQISDTISRLSAAVIVNPGPKVYIDSIRVSGNRVTKKAVILRELGCKTGDLYRQSVVNRAHDTLSRLGIFDAVKEPQLYFEKQKSLLHIEVVEGNTNSFNGVAGFNPGADGQAGYLTGTFDIRFGNLLGTGRQLSARWQKRDRNAQELALHFREPWLMNYPVHLNGGFEQLIQDTLYVERRFELAVVLPVRNVFHFIGQLRRQSIHPDSTGQAVLAIPKSTAIAAGFGLQFNTMDDLYNPRRGVYYQSMVESVRKDTGDLFEQQKLSLDFQWALPLRRFQVMHSSIHWRYIRSSEPVIDFADLYRLGGANTLRGYREEQFRGERVAWLNFEYRYLFGPRSRAFLFYDAGYVYQQKHAGVSEKSPAGAGFGVQLETRLGVVGFAYGLGRGDSLSRGKVHVRLANSF